MSLSFSCAAREAPDRVALVAEGVAYRFGDLAPRVGAAAAWLRARLDRTRASSVAFIARPGLDEIVLLHAALAIGAPVVPLHPGLTRSERDRLVADLGPVLFVAAPGARAPSPAPVAVTTPISDDDAPLAILHTSGSSGAPKGVLLSRAAFAKAAEASAKVLGWRADDRWLLCLPFAHVGGLSVLTRCLLARRAVVLSGAGSFDPGAVLDAIDRDRVTLASFVPTQLRRLLDASPSGAGPPSHLRAILVGGAAASPALLDEATARGWPVLATYGLTEACSQVATARPGDGPRGAGDCGPPLPGTLVRIVAGEIQVRGPTLLSGYLPKGAHPSPMTGDGWLATGDAGLVDDEGRLHVLGRHDRLIVTGGENVAPIEVERALEACPGVASACVFAIADDTWGELVAAALVSDRAPPPADRDLARALSVSLAGWKRPRRIAWLPSLPFLPSGKPDLEATVAAARPHLRPLVHPHFKER